MENIIFLKDTDTIYSATTVLQSANICSVKFEGAIPTDAVLTSGFYIVNENNGDNMSGDTFYGFKTIYNNVSPTIYLSNDGSHYIPPEPPEPPKPVMKDVTAYVSWIDNGDEDGIRPSSLAIELIESGKTIKKATLTAEDGWSHDFGKFEATRIFTVSAKSVDGYYSSVKGCSIRETHESTSEIRAAKLQELDSSCDMAMQSAVPVELSTGVQDFAFTELVQRDLANAYSSATALLQIGHPEIEIPFYNIEGICSLYLPNDIMAIYMTLGAYKTSNLTLLHQLEAQIADMTGDEIRNVYFSVDCLDEEHKANYDVQMEAAANVINTITETVIPPNEEDAEEEVTE